jgi:hypothetical protein
MKFSNSITKILVIIIYQLMTFSLSAQTWQWSHQIGSSWWDISVNIVTDSNGNSFSAGTFQGGYCYFPGDTSNIVLGACDFYLAKFNSSGNLQWWRQLGGAMSVCNEGVGSITADLENNMYITGGYGGPATFGSTTLSGSGSQDGFIAKYDESGNCLWANNVVSYADDGVSGVTIDNSGHVYVCGTNNDTASISGFILPPGGFIAKYDTSGNCIWAKKKISSLLLFGTNYCAADPHSIKFSNGFLTVSGFMGNDTVTIDTTTIYSKFGYSYLARFDTSGTLKWVKTFGGPQIDGLNFEHALDGSGNSYITGTCYGNGYFQTDTLQGSFWQAFIVKIDSSGNEQWVRGIVSNAGSWGNMISSDGDGNVYVTGRFRGNTTFGNYNVTSTTNEDMFIARYNSSGDCLGVRFFGRAEGFGVTQDHNGNAYVCGNFSNTITIGSNTYTSYGDKDIFIAKLDELVGLGDTRQSNNQLLIYANPNAGKCTITVPDEFINERNLTLRIFDTTGRLLQQQSLEMAGDKIKLNLEAEAKGVYSVVLSNNKKSYSGKIVFE